MSTTMLPECAVCGCLITDSATNAPWSGIAHKECAAEAARFLEDMAGLDKADGKAAALFNAGTIAGMQEALRAAEARAALLENRLLKARTALEDCSEYFIDRADGGGGDDGTRANLEAHLWSACQRGLGRA